MSEQEVEHVLLEETMKNWERTTKVKVSPKCLTLIVDRKHGYTTKLTFRKRSSGGEDTLGFDVEDSKPLVKKSRCNLGHEHIIEEKIESKEYAHMSIPWQHAEAVMEWFSSGTWRQVQTTRRDL